MIDESIPSATLLTFDRNLVALLTFICTFFKNIKKIKVNKRI